MTFTLEEFLKANDDLEKKRAAEREKEREADLLKIADMIKTGVNSEIAKAIEPLAQQQRSFEFESSKRISTLESEMNNIKNLLQQ